MASEQLDVGSQETSLVEAATQCQNSAALAALLASDKVTETLAVLSKARASTLIRQLLDRFPDSAVMDELRATEALLAWARAENTRQFLVQHLEVRC